MIFFIFYDGSSSHEDDHIWGYVTENTWSK